MASHDLGYFIQVLSVGEIDGGMRGRVTIVPGTRFLSKLPCQSSSEGEGETTPSSTSPTENTLSDLPSLNLDENTPARRVPGKLAGKRTHVNKVLQPRMSTVKGHSSPGEVDRRSLNVNFELGRVGGLRMKEQRGVATSLSHTLSEGEVPAVIRKQQRQRRIRVSDEPASSPGTRSGGLGNKAGGHGSTEAPRSTRDGIDVISISERQQPLDSLPQESAHSIPDLQPKRPQTPQQLQLPQQPQHKLIIVEPSLDVDHVTSFRPHGDPMTSPMPHLADHVTSPSPHLADHVTSIGGAGRHLEVMIPSVGATGGEFDSDSKDPSLSKDSDFNFSSYSLSISTTLPP